MAGYSNVMVSILQYYYCNKHTYNFLTPADCFCGDDVKRSFLFAVFIMCVFQVTAPPAFSLSEKSVPAKSCILIDEHGSVLYEKNSSAKLPPASTTKLMTAMVALDNLDKSAIVRVGRRASTISRVKPKLLPGDELSVTDLLHLALIKSVNSAAVALAEAAAGSESRFAEIMNRKAKEIGARNTHFVNASGLPEGRQYTTVRDLTIIMKKALTYPLIKEIIGKKKYSARTASGRQLYVENTDNMLWLRSDVIGGKTGFTRSAQHCFVGAIDTDQGLIFTAVLGAPSRSRLWKSTAMLADFGTNPPPVKTMKNSPKESTGKKPRLTYMRAALVELTRE